MALIQGPYALGTAPVARPQTAYATHTQLFIVDIPAAGIAAGDILELGVLPSYAHITDAVIIPIGSLGAATVDVGIMSGSVGELTNADGSARTNGNQIFAGAAITGLVRMTKTDALVLPQTEAERSIGVTFSAAVTAGAGKRFGLQLSFVQ